MGRRHAELAAAWHVDPLADANGLAELFAGPLVGPDLVSRDPLPLDGIVDPDPAGLFAGPFAEFYGRRHAGLAVAWLAGPLVAPLADANGLALLGELCPAEHVAIVLAWIDVRRLLELDVRLFAELVASGPAGRDANAPLEMMLETVSESALAPDALQTGSNENCLDF